MYNRVGLHTAVQGHPGSLISDSVPIESGHGAYYGTGRPISDIHFGAILQRFGDTTA